MADETKDGETKDGETKDGETKDKASGQPVTPEETLQRLRDMSAKMKDAKQKVTDSPPDFAKDLTMDQRQEVLKQVLDRFDPNKDSAQTKEMFDSMKRLQNLRSMMKTAEERMAQESAELAKDFTPVEREERMAEMLRRFEEELVPKLPDEKSRTKAMVILVVLDISERQILHGLPCEEEWIRLKKILAKREDALRVVTELETSIGKYEQDLKTAVTQSEADETQMRKANHGIIQQVLLTKLRTLTTPRPPQAESKAIEAGETKPAEPGDSKA